MFSAMELNLQEAGGPERQCDHLPVREQGDVRFYEFSHFLGMEEQFGGRAARGLSPPLATPPATPLESSEGEGVGHHKEHWDPGGQA